MDQEFVIDMLETINCNIDYCRFFVIFAILELPNLQAALSFYTKVAPTQKRIRWVLVSQS